jgi:hypothetical protein
MKDCLRTCPCTSVIHCRRICASLTGCISENCGCQCAQCAQCYLLNTPAPVDICAPDRIVGCASPYLMCLFAPKALQWCLSICRCYRVYGYILSSGCLKGRLHALVRMAVGSIGQKSLNRFVHTCTEYAGRRCKVWSSIR